jgi:hypothetical protein
MEGDIMDFEIENEPTLDESYPIIVRHLSKHEEEYIFQFAVNLKEMKQLNRLLNKKIKEIEKEKEQFKPRR